MYIVILYVIISLLLRRLFFKSLTKNQYFISSILDVGYIIILYFSYVSADFKGIHEHISFLFFVFSLILLPFLIAFLRRLILFYDTGYKIENYIGIETLTLYGSLLLTGVIYVVGVNVGIIK